MCHFITLVLSRDADLAQAGKFFVHPLEVIDNPNVRAQLETGELYVHDAGKHCDCGTIIGSARHDAAPDDNKLDSQIAKLEKKGWGEAKIEKWLRNKRHASSNRSREAKVHADMAETNGEAARWIQAVTGAVEDGAARYVGLLLHMYSGSLENEKFTLRRREQLSLQSIRPTDLAQFEEDVLYVLAT